MERTDRRSRGFIGYEYKEITADMGQISFLIDGYENFGWEVDENVAQPALETFPKRAGAMRNPALQTMRKLLHSCPRHSLFQDF